MMAARARLRLAPALLLWGLVLGCGGESVIDADPEAFESTPTYENHIRPILRDNCVPCHDSAGLRAGGVELDRYVSAYGNRVKNACVSISPELIGRFDSALKPSSTVSADPEDQSEDQSTCKDWEASSMPTGAGSPLTPHQQVLLARWVEIGAPQ